MNFAFQMRRRLGSRTTVGAEAAQNYTDKRSVHRLTHDVAEDRPTTAHQRSGNNQQVIREHESCRGGGPTRIAVEHRDHHRHIGSPDRHHQMHPQQDRDRCHDQQGR